MVGAQYEEGVLEGRRSEVEEEAGRLERRVVGPGEE